MSTASIYCFPIEELQHTLPGDAATTFVWEYEDGSLDLLKLYAKAKQQQWNAAERIDWSIELHPDNPIGLQDQQIAIYGTPFWDRLPDKEKATVRLHMQAQVISQFLHAEQGALMAAARLVQAMPTFEGKFCAATQTMDEARHIEAFGRLVHEKLKLAYPPAPAFVTLLGQILNDRRWDMTCLGMQVLLEGLGVGAFARIRDNASSPLVASVYAYALQDEARHNAFGRMAMREYYADLSEAERDEREEFVVQTCDEMWQQFFQKQVWETLGIPAEAAAQAMESSVFLREVRSRIFRRVVPAVKDIGLWGRRTQDAFERMGIIGFAAEHPEAHLEEDRRIAAQFDANRFVKKALENAP